MTHESVASRYYIRVKDISGNQVALLDNFLSLHIEHKLNDVGNYTIVLADDGDTRIDLFQLDYSIELWRSAPGIDLDWYMEFGGLHRVSTYETDDSGFSVFTSRGGDFNELLMRSTVAYKAGTIRSDKETPAETAMKEYVEENCGPTADDTVVGRLYVGGLGRLDVEPSFGNGIIWTGSRAFENLLDVLKDIAAMSDIDFAVQKLNDTSGRFIFVTRTGQLGDNRTNVGINRATGLNQYGNNPVVFSLQNGNIRNIKVEYDRSSEANVVIVLGKGDASTRTTVTVSNENFVDDTQMNRREISRTASSYDEDFETNALTTIGLEALKESQPKTVIEFEPLQQPSTFYGLHYRLGDKIVVKHRDIESVKKIVGVTIDVSGNTENISIEFSDIALVPT